MGVEWGEDTIVLAISRDGHIPQRAGHARPSSIWWTMSACSRGRLSRIPHPTSLPAAVVRGAYGGLLFVAGSRDTIDRQHAAAFETGRSRRPSRVRCELSVSSGAERRPRSGDSCDPSPSLPRDFVESELQRLQVIVDKTAGAEEFEAMALLTDHVRTSLTSMKPDSADPTVFVRDFGAFHFGLLRSGGALGRRFGGIGTAAPGPALVSARAPRQLRSLGTTRAVLKNCAPVPGEQQRVDGTLVTPRTPFTGAPAHAGLGFGATTRSCGRDALAELQGLTQRPRLRRAVGRAQVSDRHVDVCRRRRVEGGHRETATAWRPSARLPFPPGWHCVVAARLRRG